MDRATILTGHVAVGSGIARVHAGLADDGTFRVRGCPAGPVRIDATWGTRGRRVRLQGYGPVAPQPDDVLIDLSGARWIEGSVRGRDAGTGDAWVVAVPQGTDSSAAAEIGRDGRFRVPALGAGAHTLLWRRESTLWGSVVEGILAEGVVAGAVGVTLQMPDLPTTIELQVVEEDGSTASWQSAVVRDDLTGTVDVPTARDRSWWFVGLSPDVRYSVEVLTPDRLPFAAYDVQPGSVVRAVVRRGRSVRGTLVGPSGHAVPFTTLRARETGGRMVEGHTRDDGSFEISGLESPVVRLVALLPDVAGGWSDAHVAEAPADGIARTYAVAR